MSNPIMKHEECWSALQLAALASAMAGRSVFEFEGRKWAVSGIVGRDVSFTEIDQAKVPEPSGWTGEGLPPVGTVCEYDANSVGKEPNWHTVEITYISDWVIVFRCVKSPEPNLGAVGVELSKDVNPGLARFFRPIRTPEQIAAEEREREIGELREIIKQAHYALPNTDVAPVEKAKAYAEAIHAAGFRKQEQPK